MIITPADRTRSVQEYYFSKKLKEIDRLNSGRKEKIINLGIGAPDGRPPQQAIDSLVETAVHQGNHAYQSYIGLAQLRQAFADWYARYYNVILNPSDEIQPLVGSKEGILLTSLAFINKGDKVLIPDPGYPTYSSASKLVEAQILYYNLKAENKWWPDFEELERMDLEGVKIMWVNYPHMPTGAKATEELYAKIVDFGRRHKILIVNDNPYSFILCGKPLSILSIEGAKDCCLELNSLSKAHNMSGWRVGMIAGDKELVSEVLKVKSQMDSGMFKPLQLAAIEALSQGPEWFEELNVEYSRRKHIAAQIFDRIGAEYDRDSAGLFLWGRVKGRGEDISDKLLYEAGVFITPGFIFGHNGENYIRISLCASCEVLQKALEKICNCL